VEQLRDARGWRALNHHGGEKRIVSGLGVQANEYEGSFAVKGDLHEEGTGTESSAKKEKMEEIGTCRVGMRGDPKRHLKGEFLRKRRKLPLLSAMRKR